MNCGRTARRLGFAGSQRSERRDAADAISLDEALARARKLVADVGIGVRGRVRTIIVEAEGTELMLASDLDRSDRAIVQAEQRMTAHTLRMAALKARGESTEVAARMLGICGDMLAELRANRAILSRISSGRHSGCAQRANKPLLSP